MEEAEAVAGGADAGVVGAETETPVRSADSRWVLCDRVLGTHRPRVGLDADISDPIRRLTSDEMPGGGLVARLSMRSMRSDL